MNKNGLKLMAKINNIKMVEPLSVQKLGLLADRLVKKITFIKLVSHGNNEGELEFQSTNDSELVFNPKNIYAITATTVCNISPLSWKLFCVLFQGYTNFNMLTSSKSSGMMLNADTNTPNFIGFLNMKGLPVIVSKTEVDIINLVSVNKIDDDTIQKLRSSIKDTLVVKEVEHTNLFIYALEQIREPLLTGKKFMVNYPVLINLIITKGWSNLKKSFEAAKKKHKRDNIKVPAPQVPAPQVPVPQVPAPQAPVIQAPVPQAPVPQAPVPQAPDPQAPAPQVPVPQAPAPQAPAPQAPAPQAPAPQAPAPQAPAPQAPAQESEHERLARISNECKAEVEKAIKANISKLSKPTKLSQKTISSFTTKRNAPVATPLSEDEDNLPEIGDGKINYKSTTEKKFSRSKKLRIEGLAADAGEVGAVHIDPKILSQYTLDTTRSLETTIFVKIDPGLNDAAWGDMIKLSGTTYAILESKKNEELSRKVYVAFSNLTEGISILYMNKRQIFIIDSDHLGSTIKSPKVINRNSRRTDARDMEILKMGTRNIDVADRSNAYIEHRFTQLYFWYTVARLSKAFKGVTATAMPSIDMEDPEVVYSPEGRPDEDTNIMSRPLQGLNDSCVQCALVAMMIDNQALQYDFKIYNMPQKNPEAALVPIVDKTLKEAGLKPTKFMQGKLATTKKNLPKLKSLLMKLIRLDQKHMVYARYEDDNLIIFNSWEKWPIYTTIQAREVDLGDEHGFWTIHEVLYLSN